MTSSVIIYRASAHHLPHAALGQLLIRLVGVHLCIDHIIVRGSYPDNNERFSFTLLLFSLLLPTKWIAKTCTHQQCFYAQFIMQECNTEFFLTFRIVFMCSILGDEVSHVSPFGKLFWRSSDAHSGFSITWILESTSG